MAEVDDVAERAGRAGQDRLDPRRQHLLLAFVELEDLAWGTTAERLGQRLEGRVEDLVGQPEVGPQVGARPAREEGLDGGTVAVVVAVPLDEPEGDHRVDADPRCSGGQTGASGERREVGGRVGERFEDPQLVRGEQVLGRHVPGCDLKDGCRTGCRGRRRWLRRRAHGVRSSVWCCRWSDRAGGAVLRPSQITGRTARAHPRYLGLTAGRCAHYHRRVDARRGPRVRKDLEHLSREGLDWVSLAREATDLIATVVPFDRSCWHTVDPGTVLFTGSVNRDIGCSGTWLAEHEYVIEDVNKWSFLARSGRRAGATGLATHGDLSRSARHRSQEGFGIGDELRGSFVKDGDYWGAAGFLRNDDRGHFSEADVTFLASLSDTLADGVRRALVAQVMETDVVSAGEGPGVVLFDGDGQPEMISPAAEHWIAQLVEEPPPATPTDSKLVQAVAVRARTLGPGDDPLRGAARSRARTRGGRWLVLYGTPLAGGTDRRTAVVIQPAAPHEVAPLVALAYGLSDRECQVVRHCMEGRPTKQIAVELHVSPYTVQDHLKSIFDKTGVRTRNELVGQIFLEHYASRWEEATGGGDWVAWRPPDPR